MSLTVWADVESALFSALSAELDVPVYDGHPLTDDPQGVYVIVGGSTDPNDDSSGTFTTEWHDCAGPDSTMDEHGEVRVVVAAESGDDAARLSTLRAQCFAVVNQIGEVFRADPTLGLADTPMSPEITMTTGRPVQGPTSAGIEVQCWLTFKYHAII